MNRPERRKSSLTGANPVAPAADDSDQPTSERPATEQLTSQPATADRTPPTNSTPPSHTATSTAEARPRKYPPKVSFYQDPEDTARLRAAYRHTLAATSDRSLSDFITRVVMAEVERLENQHNGGRPFPSVGAGEIPQGRPVGE